MFRAVKLCSNKYVLVCCFVWSMMLLIYYVINESPFVSMGHVMSFRREHAYTNVSSFTSDHINNETFTARRRQECIHPQLAVDDPVMMKYYQKLPDVQCQEEPDWIYVDNGTIRFSQPALDKYRPMHCNYYPLNRKNDYETTVGAAIKDIPDGFLITTDHFQVTCNGNDGKLYEAFHMGVAHTKERADRSGTPFPNSMDNLSIAILGFDSMSRMSWLRRLPQTRKYFTSVLGAIELEAHNIVGDGTTAVMLPMLTGKFEWELPECRTNFKGAKTMDTFPFLWHEMKKAGYLTSWANGSPLAAPFNWRMMGFTQQPTDFYPRTFYLAVEPKIKKYSNFCIGARSWSKVWFSYFRDIFKMYKDKPKFLFHFLTELSHDNNNYMTKIDEELRNLVQFLWEGSYLNNTLLILMGDHGARYGGIRTTWSGKLEERLPYISLYFPEWFQRKYPEAMKNVHTNSKRLTTPFDLHKTFTDILRFDGARLGDVSERGISLFKEIPLERSCDHASIVPHWCACLAWKNVSLDDLDTKNALQVSLDTINNYTSNYRDLCALLIIANVTMATKLETRSEVLKFMGTDSDGGIYKIDMTGKNKNELVLYQLTFYTSPGGAHFEVTVTHDLVHKKFFLSDKEISRINKYGDDPACILDKNRQIRAYCYCKNNIKS